MKKRRPKSWLLWGLLMISVGLNLVLWQGRGERRETEGFYRVRRVLDGDSFVIGIDESIRLINVDAPEYDFCLGKEAKERLEELILEKEVKIEPVGKDQFHRVLAFVYLPDGRLVNEIMLAEGLARYNRNKTRLKERMKSAANRAKEQKLGIWSPKCYQLENPENPECNIKGNINKRTGEKFYHLPECLEYGRVVVELNMGEQWFCSEEEAQRAGYRKAGSCDLNR